MVEVVGTAMSSCNAGDIGQESGFLSYQTIYNRIASNDYEEFWDTSSAVSYACGGANNDFITYDFPTSILMTEEIGK